MGLDYQEVTHIDDDFTLKIPRNGANIAAGKESGIYFAWQELAYADQYSLIISKDASYKNIVVDKIVDDNYATIQGLEKNTTYYWKVISRQQASSVPQTIPCKSMGYSFTVTGI